jgi:hypothetical protein
LRRRTALLEFYTFLVAAFASFAIAGKGAGSFRIWGFVVQ